MSQAGRAEQEYSLITSDEELAFVCLVPTLGARHRKRGIERGNLHQSNCSVQRNGRR